jgi:cytochrome P450
VTVKTAPGPREKSLFGSLARFKTDPLRLFIEETGRHGDTLSLRFGPQRALFFSHPDHVQRVLLDNHRNYGKQTQGWNVMRLLLGNGLLTSEGSFWLRQRRIAQPAFHRERIAGFGESIVRAAEARTADWELGKPIDVASEMMRLTLRVVGETLLGVDLESTASEVGPALDVSIHEVMSRFSSPLQFLPLAFPTPRNRRFSKAIKIMDGVVRGVIATRRANPDGRADLLTMLMETRDEDTGERMNDQQLRDEAMTIFLAGHETTANALTWTFYLLSLHPDVARRLQEELRRVLGGRAPAMSDLGRLDYTRRVLMESMRLYPPAWIITRSTAQPDEIGGYRVTPKHLVMLSSYITHRHPEFWENPEGFDPDRFEGDLLKKLPRFAYFPFGGGPRQCIGNEFAMMEALLILATIAQRVRLDLVPGHIVELDPVVTLRPKYGMRMRPVALR